VSNERDLVKQEVAELQVKYTTLLQQNERIKEQLRLLESESFEIQARVRRGVEVERENENISRTVEDQRDRDL
jgi:predicted ATP-grasp superfamily ATP-dependent carboligase